ncbi:hypothetical protein DL96DRAFT_1709531 [Flagelloscypha sp. PMI_526]|nr:hypothetical protein DL96DRAFT_1709531 [Flagelloscypha sp. PMI_526]
MPEDLPLSTYDIPNQTTSLEPISDVAAGGSIPLSNGHSLSLSPKSDTDVDLPLLPGFTGHVNVDGGSNSEQEESRSDGGPDIIYSSAVTPQAALEAEDFVSETSLLADHAHEDMPRYETWLLEPPQDIFVTDTSSPYLEPESEAGQTAVNVQVGLDINVDGDEDSERVPPQPGSSAVDEVLEDVTVEEDGQNMVVNSQSDLIVESFNKSSNIVDPTHPHPDASTDKDSLFGDESSEIPDVGASEAAIDQQVAERQQHTNDEQADIDDHDSLFDGPTPPQETMDYQIEGYQSEKRPEQAGNSGLKVRDKVAGLSPALDEASQSPVNGTLGLDHSHRLKFAVRYNFILLLTLKPKSNPLFFSAEAASNSVVSLQPQANNSPNDQTALSTGQTSPQPHKSLRSKRKRENSGKLNSRSVRTKFPETMIEDGPSTSLTTSTSPAKTKSQRRRQTSPAAESASGSSDASHVARLLEQDSREASPGLYRPNAPGPIPLPHLLFHNHGNRRSSSLLTTMPKLHTSRPSPHRSQTTASQALTSTKTPDSSPTKGALLHFAPTSSSPASPSTPTMPISPVTPSLTGTPDISSLHPTQRATRSNCRYHNISLPSTDEQTRVHFLVPGCSLSNHRIESHFDAYLIGNIRKLVGVDLIRENEIYWLPRPGQNVPPATRRVEKKHSKRASKQFADSDRNGPLSPQLSFASSGSRSSRAPVSNAGSTSTTANLVLDRLGEDAPSELDEDVQSPVSDNRWTTHESAVAGPSSTPLDAQNGKRKRGRGHLSADASAYVPQDEQESSSEDGEPQNKKKVLKRRGQKG